MAESVVEYEDSEVIVVSDYDPAQHIYDDNCEVNLWKVIH